MARQVILQPAYTFDNFCLLPGYTRAECVPPNISLETNLTSRLSLKTPFLSAAMMSVTGYEMVVALGKEGGIGIIPSGYSPEEQADIARRAKATEMNFVSEPLSARPEATIESVLNLIEQHGHSRIPIVDRDNVFLGMFVHADYLQQRPVGPEQTVQQAMHTLDSGKVSYSRNPQISIDEVKTALSANGTSYLVVLDDQRRLRKMAFRKDVEELKVGAAISTHPGWENRVKALSDVGTNLIVIDSSDVHKEFLEQVLGQYRAAGYPTPISAGNVVTYGAALCLMRAGADILKVGMSPGSICITDRQKGTARGPVTALMEVIRARDEFYSQTGRYVPVISDGGMPTSREIILALTLADAIMNGHYFNRFLEAAGEKLDADMKVTREEHAIEWVATWGEGSERARNLLRYEHTEQTFFPEGVEGKVPYAGRMKPNLKRDMTKIRSAMSTAGAIDLDQFRQVAILELQSDAARGILKNPHDVQLLKSR